jgi:alpha-beta hydrolase superfamily lysophospholipase
MFQEIYIKSRDKKLYAKLYLKDKNLPTILLLHGLGFHSFEYDKLAPLLFEQGYNCLSLDFGCCGKSEGRRGYCTLNNYTEDTFSALDYIRLNINGNIGIFGNSLGGTVAFYSKTKDCENKIKSLIVSNCASKPINFGLNTKFRKILLKLSKFISKIIPLRISVNYFIPYKSMLTNNEIIQSIKNDSLVSNARKFHISTYEDMLSWDITKIDNKINIPVLIITQKEKDKLQFNNQSILLYNSLKEPKELKEIDTGHLPDIENPDLICKILVDWFNKTLK